MIGGHIGDHPDVVVQRADASQEDPSSSGLQNGQFHAGLRQGPCRTTEPREVPFFHQPVVDVHAIGRRVGHREPGRSPEMGEGPRRKTDLPPAHAHRDRHRQARRAGEADWPLEIEGTDGAEILTVDQVGVAEPNGMGS